MFWNKSNSCLREKNRSRLPNTECKHIIDSVCLIMPPWEIPLLRRKGRNKGVGWGVTYFFGPSQHDRQTAEARRIKGKGKDRSNDALTRTHARTHASLPSRSKENACWPQQFICFCLTSHDAFSLHLQRVFTFTACECLRARFIGFFMQLV